MSESLTHDVFFSYSSQDKVVVRAVAERFDTPVEQFGDSTGLVDDLF